MFDSKLNPAVAALEITKLCNMRCRHCGNSSGTCSSDELTTEEMLAVIDDLIDMGVKGIGLTGGEPLLRRDCMDLIKHIRERGKSCCIMTNGYAVTPRVIEKLKDAGVNGINVSIDGLPDTHNFVRCRRDAFDKAVNAMQLVRDAKVFDFAVTTTISKINFHEVRSIWQMLIDLGSPRWRIQTATCTGRMEENKEFALDVDEYYDLINLIIEIKRDGRIKVDLGDNIGYFGCKGTEVRDGYPFLGCTAGIRSVAITSNGDVKGCASMPDDFIEGNIRKHSIREIWGKNDNFAYNRQFTREEADGECKDCRYLALCRGGCTSTSYSMTGCVANSPYCSYKVEMKRGIEPKDTPMIKGFLKRCHGCGNQEDSNQKPESTVTAVK